MVKSTLVCAMMERVADASGATGLLEEANYQRNWFLHRVSRSPMNVRFVRRSKLT
jgi:hypothetical protein